MLIKPVLLWSDALILLLLATVAAPGSGWLARKNRNLPRALAQVMRSRMGRRLR
jgi:hypothetical protein